MAINPDDGEILWSKQHDISFTYPLVTDERVLFHANERLQAYEIETGDTLWEFDTLNNRIARPVVADDTVYVEYGDETVGLKLNDGSKGPEITKSFEGEFAFVDDAVIESVGDKFRAYDLQRDELLWEKDYPARLNPPAVADGIAYVGGEDKRIRGVEISTGQELWSRQLKDDVMRPVVAQGSVLVVSGETLYSLA
jgi:outer membrane protein assembly factor BamB